MNLSFVVLGITMISGALIFAKRLNVNYYAKFGFWCMAAAGFGTILVGVFPESTIDAVHSIGASLPFVFGNLGMILIGCCMDRLPKVLRLFTILSGVLGLLALVLFIFDIYLGLGIGGMERVVAYPQTIWMIVFGWVLGCKKASRQLVHRG